MQKWQGFADNGACPVDPTGDKTPLITKTALLLLGSGRADGFCISGHKIKRPADLSIVRRLGGFSCCKITHYFSNCNFFIIFSQNPKAGKNFNFYQVFSRFPNCKIGIKELSLRLHHTNGTAPEPPHSHPNRRHQGQGRLRKGRSQ